MRKYKHRFCIFGTVPFEFDRMERLLEKEAKQGWMVDGFTGFNVTFRKEKPADRRYRILYSRSMESRDYFADSTTRGLIDALEDGGWKLAVIRRQIMIFYTDDADAPEPESDELLKFKCIQECMSKTYVAPTAMLCFLGLLQSFNCFAQSGEDWYRLFGHAVHFPLFVLMLSLAVFNAGLIVVYKLWEFQSKRSLERGGYIVPPRGSRLLIAAFAMIAVISVLFMIAGAAYEGRFGDAAAFGLIIVIIAAFIFTVFVADRYFYRKASETSENENGRANLIIGFGAVVVAIVLSIGIQAVLTKAEVMNEPNGNSCLPWYTMTSGYGRDVGNEEVGRFEVITVNKANTDKTAEKYRNHLEKKDACSFEEMDGALLEVDSGWRTTEPISNYYNHSKRIQYIFVKDKHIISFYLNPKKEPTAELIQRMLDSGNLSQW